MAYMGYRKSKKNKAFHVSIDNDYSQIKELNFSVPQGSCARAILYSAYAATVKDVISNEVVIHGLADDQAFKSTFPASSRTEEENVYSVFRCEGLDEQQQIKDE